MRQWMRRAAKTMSGSAPPTDPAPESDTEAATEPSTSDTALQGLFATIREHGYRRYQPLFGLEEAASRQLGQPSRPVDERWNLIADHLPTKGLALDIGSQYGWFTFKMASLGLYAIGVERAEADYHLSQWISLYNGFDNVGFLRMDITPDTVPMLPDADVVICFSIYHHWAISNGEEYATGVLQRLANKTRYRMFFETGQADETDRSWSKKLRFMGSDPTAWLASTLERVGFDTVEVLGSTQPGKGEGRFPRQLYAATKSQQGGCRSPR